MAIDPICGMKVEESKGYSLETGGVKYYFCSKGCMEKYAAENGIADQQCVSCAPAVRRRWYSNRLIPVIIAVITPALAADYIKILQPYRISLMMYVGRIWWAVLAGLILGGMIDHFVPRKYISHVLARPGKMTIINAVLLGFLMSACSHGILALAIQIHKKGASTPAVVAFLMASPWANLPLTIMLLSFFGLKALFIILSAIVIALSTGFIFQILEARGITERNTASREVESGFSILADIKQRVSAARFSAGSLFSALTGVQRGAVSLADMVLWWIILGVGIASVTGAYVPQEIFRNYMGPSISGLFVTLALATVLEVCSEGTAPLAFEIYRQTGAMGNVFVFLMAGVVTDYTEIGLLWANVGKKTAILLPVIAVPQVVALGIVANILL